MSVGIWPHAIEACRSPAGVSYYRHRRYKALLQQVAFNKALFGALRVAKEGYLYYPLNLIPPAVFRPEDSKTISFRKEHVLKWIFSNGFFQ